MKKNIINAKRILEKALGHKDMVVGACRNCKRMMPLNKQGLCKKCEALATLKQKYMYQQTMPGYYRQA